MTYSVKEIFLTWQGEGMNTGRQAVFCRFSGCNLWSGREADRPGSVCDFCDTDFVGTNGSGGGKFPSAGALSAAICAHWPEHAGSRFVVLTGGEPLLQVDKGLVDSLHAIGCEVAVETNGTRRPPPGLDWICVSPKVGAPLRLRRGDELKLVYPQDGVDPGQLVGLDFDHFLLQPMDGPDFAANLVHADTYAQANPPWRLSLQTHKMMGIR